MFEVLICDAREPAHFRSAAIAFSIGMADGRAALDTDTERCYGTEVVWLADY